MEPKITVIVPCYNIAPWLSRCLDSILAQTYSDLEVIVVDDGSTDGTAAVMADYAARDERIKNIHQENGGVTAARLRGVAEATGDWLGFVDGDDCIEPDMYRRLLANAAEHRADISHCGYQMVFPSGRTDYYYNTGRVAVQEGLQGCQDLLTGAFVEPGLWNKLYRRELFAGLTGWMDTTIRNNEDLLMNYYLFRQAKRAVFDDWCPYHYILRPSSATTSALNAHKLADPLKVTHQILADAPEQLRDIVLVRLTRQLISLASMNGHPGWVLPHRKTARRELRQRLREILRSRVGPKLKVMALWTALWPASYGWVHGIHNRVTGNDRKYDLN